MHAKTNHTLARVSDDINSPTHVSNDMSNPVRVSEGISRPIRLWHVSPIRFHHMSLTHPQTPINRSLPKAFKKRPSHLKHKQHQRRFRSTETLLESSLEASKNFKNFDLECKEHSKQNHLNYLPRSQRSLESSSKASKNLNKP